MKFPEGVIYEDTSFYINLIPYIHSVACIEEPLAYRLRREHSTTTTITAERVAQIFEVIKHIEKWYQEKSGMIFIEKKKNIFVRVFY